MEEFHDSGLIARDKQPTGLKRAHVVEFDESDLTNVKPGDRVLIFYDLVPRIVDVVKHVKETREHAGGVMVTELRLCSCELLTEKVVPFTYQSSPKMQKTVDYIESICALIYAEAENPGEVFYAAFSGSNEYPCTILRERQNSVICKLPEESVDLLFAVADRECE